MPDIPGNSSTTTVITIGGTVSDVLEVLFRRKLDTHQTTFAMGEAIAHLHYLLYAGRAARKVGADGVVRYAPAA